LQRKTTQTAGVQRFTDKLRWQLTTLLFLVVATITQVTQAASNELFGGSLGAWLRDDAQTQLTDLLSSHPRFRGERIRVVVMRDGLPAAQADGLAQAIRAQLTHKLAQINKVQLVWGDSLRGCQVPRKTPYLLGVEVERESRHRHLVRIAMVDVEEGVWVSGAHLQWRGLLTQAERQAKQTLSVEGAAGTIDKPLAATNRLAVVEQLLASIQCSLRGGVEGSVHIAAADPNDALLAELAVQLRKRVLHSAWLTVADNPLAADWQLRLVAAKDVGESVVATLSAGAQGGKDASSQRLAAVYIRRDRAEAVPVEFANAVSNEPYENLLGEITPVPVEPGETCFSPRANCTEVQFDMAEPGYVLVVRNSGGTLGLSSCKVPARSSGLKRYRFHAADLGRGDVSVYAVATTDRKLAAELHREFSSVASNCGRGSPVSSGAWLANLEQLVSRAPDKIHWQAFYPSPEILAQATNP